MLIIGKNHVNRAALGGVALPKATDRYVPVAHSTLVELAESALSTAGFSILEEDHVLARSGQRYFGGFSLTRPDLVSNERSLFVGLRNSHDKSIPASICIGNRMLVCENMCFSAEKKLARRHSTHVMRDLPGVFAQCIASLVGEWQKMEERIQAYKSVSLTLDQASRLGVQLVDSLALPKASLYDVVKLWQDPAGAAKSIVVEAKYVSHENGVDQFDATGYDTAIAEKRADLTAQFGGGTLWGLYNAVTQELKGSDVTKLPSRTIKMQSVFDALTV